MKLLKINKLLNDLNNNKIIAMPTETVYGFFSLISLENLKNINKLKGRELEKPLQVFFLDFSQIEKYTKLSQFQKQILIQELPGNKSFLVPSSSFFKKLTNQNTILIRLPIWEQKILKNTKKVFEKINVPLFATSANLTNNKEFDNGKLIQKEFKINGFNKKIKTKKSSIIISLLEDKVEIIRN